MVISIERVSSKNNCSFLEKKWYQSSGWCFTKEINRYMVEDEFFKRWYHFHLIKIKWSWGMIDHWLYRWENVSILGKFHQNTLDLLLNVRFYFQFLLNFGTIFLDLLYGLLFILLFNHFLVIWKSLTVHFDLLSKLGQPFLIFIVLFVYLFDVLIFWFHLFGQVYQ